MGTVTRMPSIARAERIPRTAPAIVKESAEMCPITTHVDSTAARARYRFFCLVGFFHSYTSSLNRNPTGNRNDPVAVRP